MIILKLRLKLSMKEKLTYSSTATVAALIRDLDNPTSEYEVQGRKAIGYRR